MDDFGILFEYKDCKVIWGSIYSDIERKNRADFLKSHEPWNKGLTVNNNEKMRKLQNNRNQTMSKILKEKYASGEMKAWKKGLTKEIDKRVVISASKASKTMALRGQNNNRAISGIRKDIGHHAASTYEANIYRILQYHGCRYLREFDIVKKMLDVNGNEKYYRIDILDIDGCFGFLGAYLEIKGFYKKEDRLKVKLFREQYPNEKLLLVGY